MLRVAVLISGNGNNLQALIELQGAEYKIEIVISDRNCKGIGKARRAGLNFIIVDRNLHRDDLFKTIDKELKNVDLIVFAGFLSIADKEFIDKWKGRIINIHPSLLPKYGGKGMYGMNVHKAVIENKEKESGCTVHYVNEVIDGGEIIAQSKVAVNENDTPETLLEKVLFKEQILLPEVIIKLSKEL